MHTAFDADIPLLKRCEKRVIWHEIVAGAKTVAVCAVAEVVLNAVEFVFQTAQFFVAEGLDEVVEISACES